MHIAEVLSGADLNITDGGKTEFFEIREFETVDRELHIQFNAPSYPTIL